MDGIFIKIKVKMLCIIGLYEKERTCKQRLNVTVKIKSCEFIDYARLDEIIRQIYEKSEFKTLEESFKPLLAKIKEDFGKIDHIKIKACKINALKKSKACVYYEKIFA